MADKRQITLKHNADLACGKKEDGLILVNAKTKYNVQIREKLFKTAKSK